MMPHFQLLVAIAVMGWICFLGRRKKKLAAFMFVNLFSVAQDIHTIKSSENFSFLQILF